MMRAALLNTSGSFTMLTMRRAGEGVLRTIVGVPATRQDRDYPAVSALAK
jgi:hypothetical protein